MQLLCLACINLGVKMVLGIIFGIKKYIFDKREKYV
jgi:hypothetical protein